MTFEELKGHFLAEEVDTVTTDLIIKQLEEY